MKLAASLRGKKRGMGCFCTTKKQKTAWERPHRRSPQSRCCQPGINGNKQETDNRQQLIHSGGRDFNFNALEIRKQTKKDNRHQRVEIYVLRRIRNVVNNQESGDLNVAVQLGLGTWWKSIKQLSKAQESQSNSWNLFSVNFIKIKSCRGKKAVSLVSLGYRGFKA